MAPGICCSSWPLAQSGHHRPQRRLRRPAPRRTTRHRVARHCQLPLIMVTSPPDPLGVRKKNGYMPQAIGETMGGTDPSCLEPRSIARPGHQHGADPHAQDPGVDGGKRHDDGRLRRLVAAIAPGTACPAGRGAGRHAAVSAAQIPIYHTLTQPIAGRPREAVGCSRGSGKRRGDLERARLAAAPASGRSAGPSSTWCGSGTPGAG